MENEAPVAEATPAAAAADAGKENAEGAEGSLLDAKPEGQDGKPAAEPNASPNEPKAEPTKDEKPVEPVVPEKYTAPKPPEGIEINQAMLDKFDTAARDLKLTQEQRDSILGMQFELTQAQIKQTMDTFHAQIAEWEAETKKELGADPAKALSTASKAIDRIFTDPKENEAFRTMMRDTGLGNWKLMVKAFQFMGRSISEDTLVNGKPSVEKEKSLAERLYGDSAAKKEGLGSLKEK